MGNSDPAHREYVADHELYTTTCEALAMLGKAALFEKLKFKPP